MKKVLFVAVALMTLCAMPSCKKVCKCSNDVTSQIDEIETTKEFPTCKDVEDVLDDSAMGLVDFSCK